MQYLMGRGGRDWENSCYCKQLGGLGFVLTRQKNFLCVFFIGTLSREGFVFHVNLFMSALLCQFAGIYIAP